MSRKALFFVLAFFLVFTSWKADATGQDLSVKSVTINVSSIQAGETVHGQAVIENLGPGTALTAQYGWFLSTDSALTSDDVWLGDVQTLNQVLYQGESATVEADLVVPPQDDPDPPSFLGVILDPHSVLFDPNPSNDSAAGGIHIANPPGTAFDPVGDNDLDLTAVSASVHNDSLRVELAFARPLSACYGFMALDLDQDPTTGHSGLSVPGAEAMLNIVIQEYFSSLELTTASGTRYVSTFQVDGNTLSYDIPLSWLGQDTDMDLFWAVDSNPGTSADLDRVPDVGAYSTSSQQVVVRRPGDTSISCDLLDPVTGGTEFPDIQKLEADVHGDQLWISLTFDHPVDNLDLQPGSDGLFIWIDLDRDRRLATGFKNSGQQPPSFGIDSTIRLQIDPLAGNLFELLQDADGDGSPEVTPMGLPVNDIFVRRNGRRIDIRMPLAYLGHHDGSGAVVVSGLNTRNILSGPVDAVPDSGAWDLAADELVPAQACSSPAEHFADPADDSVGAFGLDNDELLGLDLCLGRNALLFSLDYESYALSNDGATLIFFDVDDNQGSGWEITNITKQVTIGADFILRTYWYTDNLEQITKVLKCTPPEEVRVTNQLTTVTLADRIFVSVPFECLGNPSGQVKLFVQTASWGGGPILLPNDDLPNNGLITVNLNPCQGNFDADRDVDGSDLAVFAADFGRTDCNGECQGDFDKDNDVDGSDLATFAADFGRTDCP